MEHIGRDERGGNADEPEAAQIVEHPVQRIAARAEHAHDLYIRNVAQQLLKRAEHRYHQRRVQRELRERIACGEDGDERAAEQDREPADQKTCQRREHRKARRVGHAARDFALPDGFSHHDDACVAESDKERERQIGERAENGHTRVILVALVGIDDVEHQNAQRPEKFVQDDRCGAAEEQLEIPRAECEQLPDRAYEHVFLKRREYENQHRPKPRRNARGQRRAAHTHGRQAEFAEDQAVVDKGVGDGGANRDVHRQLHTLGVAQHDGQNVRQRHGRVGKAYDAQVLTARGDNGLVPVKKPQNPSRRAQRHEQKYH